MIRKTLVRATSVNLINYIFSSKFPLKHSCSSDWSTCIFSCFKQCQVYFFILIFFFITEESLISQETENSDPAIFVLKPDNMAFDASKSSCQSDIDITNDKNKSTGEKFNMCPEEGNKRGSEMVWKALLPNQDNSMTQDSKENLPPPQPLTSRLRSPIPAIPPLNTSLSNLSTRTTLHLDISSPSPPAALNALKSQVESMSPLCRQAMVSPTEMKSLRKESQKQLGHIEEKLTPRMSHTPSSGLLKAPVKDSSLVAPRKNVENAQTVAQCNTAKSAMPVPAVDGPNLVDSGIVFFRWKYGNFSLQNYRQFCSFTINRLNVNN